MLNNLTNFFNLIKGKRIKKKLDPTDLIAVGTKQSPQLGDYKPTAILFDDLRNQLGGILEVQDEGIALPTEPILDFQGAGVTATDGVGKTIVTIPGGVTSVTATAPVTSSGGNTPNIALPQATALVDGYLGAADWTTFNNKVSTTRTISTTSPLAGGGDLSADRTLSIADAVADGTTKGAAAFTASDFNSAAGVISIDYTNGQAASAVNKGFLTAADWTTFSYNNQIQDEGSNVTQRTTVNFVGSGVTVTDTGGKTQVSITGGGAGGTVKTIQLGITEASTGATLALSGNLLVLNNNGSGAGVLINSRWQFVVPADFVSGGQVILDVLRTTNVLQTNLFVYVNGTISNINGGTFSPAATNTWQTFTFALTTAVVAGDTITVQAQPGLTNGQNLQIRDSYFNYQS